MVNRKKMKIRVLQNKNLILLVGLALISLVGYLWLIQQPFFETFIEWAQRNLFLYIGILVLLKILAVVWPPLPGSIFTIGSIPVIGWFTAALVNIIGGVVGASIAFYLGKKYGYLFLGKIVDENVLQKIRDFRVVKEKEFEAIFVLRLFTGIVSEVISYGAGVMNIRYRNFLIPTVLVSLLDLPLFYLTGSLFDGRNVFFNIMLLSVFGFVFWKLKGRYFE